LDTTLAHSDPI